MYKHRVTPANTPRWDLPQKSEKIEGVRVIFSLLYSLLHAFMLYVV